MDRGFSRSTSDLYLSKLSSVRNFNLDNKSDSFPDLVASDTSTNSGDKRLMATTSPARGTIPPIDSHEAAMGLNQDSSSSLEKFGESWRSSATEVTGNRFRGKDLDTPPVPAGGRRNLMQRASSVPTDILGASDLRRRGSRRPEESKSPILLNTQDNQGEDDSIDDSWRVSAEKRRILQETLKADGQLGISKSSLDDFLDSLIFDSKNSRWDSRGPSQVFRKRHLHARHPSSSHSVGSALDRRSVDSDRRQSADNASVPSSAGSSIGHRSGSPTAGMSAKKSNPIAWSRKGRRRDQAGPSHEFSDAGILAFLQQETNQIRPTSAHTISGDPRADRVSIALSDTDGTMTYQIGEREARLIKSLLQNSQHENSVTKETMKDWLEATATSRQSATNDHDRTLHTVCSDIAESDRISSRSSLMVELSPPFQGKSDLRTYLDKRRSRDRRSSAFTVAGDHVSSRFQGKSTQELVELIALEKKQMNDLNLGVPMVGVQRGLSATTSGALHDRGLQRMTSVPNLPTEIFPNDGPAEDDDLLDTARIERTSDHLISQDNLGTFLDRTVPDKSVAVSGAYSLSGDRIEKYCAGRRRAHSNPRRRSPSNGRASSAPRPGRQPSFEKDLDLDDFRPPSSARPTNRRTMMRKMQSVPILTDTNLDQTLARARQSSPSPQRRRKRSRSKQGRKSRSESPRGRKKRDDNGSDTGSKTSRASRRGGKRKPHKGDRGDELTVDDLKKSFLDKYLDGDIEAHDSASQVDISKELYKASLHSAPVENSSTKLRLEPELLELSQRIILQDPAKPNRRDGLKKIKSVPAMSDPSPALKDLYDPVIPMGDRFAKSAKKPGSKAGKKKKKGAKKQKDGTKKEAKPVKIPESIPLDSGSHIDRVTLKDLPRFREESLVENSPPARRDALTKMKSCSNLDRRSYDVKDRLLLMKRLKSLTNDAPSSPTDDFAAPKKPLSERITMSEKGSRHGTPIRNVGENSPGGRKSKAKLQSPKSAPGRKGLVNSNGRWKSVPRGLGSDLHSTPKRSSVDPDGISPRKGGKGLPSLPFDSMGASSKHKVSSGNNPDDSPDHCAPPSVPKRKTSRNPSENIQNAISSHTKPSPKRKKKKGKNKHMRPIPMTIGEGSILECNPDDGTVCSDITDGFSMESWEVEQYRAAKRKSDLQRINEEENSEKSSHHMRAKFGESWGDLSFSDNASNFSVDKRQHLSKRWQSTPNMKVDDDVLKSPVRGKVEPAGKKRFGWLKKKIPFGKK